MRGLVPAVRAGLLTGALALAAACASTGGASGGSDSNVITAEELPAGRFANAEEAIRRLRPTWLIRLGGIFVEGHETSLETLRLEPVAAIAEIRRLRCEQAMARYPVSCVSDHYLEITRKR
ncbi:MAG: hypothetical protein RJQ04_00850 [Longimicrobiales bacterium]